MGNCGLIVLKKRAVRHGRLAPSYRAPSGPRCCRPRETAALLILSPYYKKAHYRQFALSHAPFISSALGSAREHHGCKKEPAGVQSWVPSALHTDRPCRSAGVFEIAYGKFWSIAAISFRQTQLAGYHRIGDTVNLRGLTRPHLFRIPGENSPYH